MLAVQHPPSYSFALYKPSPFLCRNLFGKVDHHDLKLHLLKQLKLMNHENCDRWNFDFAREEPIPGDLSWENVDTVPSTYRVTQLEHAMLSKYPKLSIGIDSDLKKDSDKCKYPLFEAFSSPMPKAVTEIKRRVVKAKRRRSLRLSQPSVACYVGGKRKLQSQITDFFPQRKMARISKA